MKEKVLPNARDDIVTGAIKSIQATVGQCAKIVVCAITRSQDVEDLEDNVSDREIHLDEIAHLVPEEAHQEHQRTSPHELQKMSSSTM